MKITHAKVDELQTILIDVLDDIGPRIREAADVWLDDASDADERREARETLDNDLDEFQGHLEDLVKLIA